MAYRRKNIHNFNFVYVINACRMVKMICRLLLLPGLSIFIACNGGSHSGNKEKEALSSNNSQANLRKDTYGYDADFLNKHLSDNTIELKSADGSAKVLLSADYQARVMTSTAGGDSGNSYGWINYGLIAAGKKKGQFNPFGGEERCWIGPEGGQYSLYFKKGDSFAIRHWQVPAGIDTLSWQGVKAGS